MKEIYQPILYVKKPTKKYIEQFTEYVNSINTAEVDVLVCYKIKSNSCTTRGGYLYSELKKGERIALSEKDLETESNRRKELYAIREGYSSCCYCRKQVPTESMIESTIIGRGRKQIWNGFKGCYESKACTTQEKLKFCSGECAGNEQMSREG